ncbi:MAG: hypothetical protein CMH61_02615 [Nanoarchaeota archaeon]|nr:hypothetical protein [Nanoarchaeota archaeon]|tara:strand:+ start:866 stop:1201 length:336 start_codon:yes stop_codon:yes gene_type:complete
MTHKLYTPEHYQKEKLSAYWEVWEGLHFPLELFQETPSAGGDAALRYTKGGHYIWIPPETKRQIERDDSQLLLAMIEGKSSKINATYVTICDVASPIRHAMKLNNELADKK